MINFCIHKLLYPSILLFFLFFASDFEFKFDRFWSSLEVDPAFADNA